MKPRNRHELEAWGCVTLFIFVILALASWSLYEHGYLGIAIAVIAGVTLSVRLIRVYRVRVARKDQTTQRRSQLEEEWQTQIPWEQEGQLEYEERLDHPVPRESREEEEQPEVPLRRAAIVQRLNEISDKEFEQLARYYLRNRGYVIDTTIASGGRGADLVISAGEGRISVLLKRQDAPVSNRAVQEALGGRAFYGTYEAWLITNNTFTREARYDAKRKDVRLTDRDELADWLEKLPDPLEDEP